ncbi:MAG: ATPase, T2SS/T4P/T4SS family [Candidatus Helarchaeota archaeon]
MNLKEKVDCNYKIERDYKYFDDQEALILIINCEKCYHYIKYQNDHFFNKICLKNINKLFLNHPYLKKVKIETVDDIFELTPEQINLFLNYTKNISKVLQLKRPRISERIQCKKKDECQKKQDFFLDRVIKDEFSEGLIFSEPIISFLEISRELQIYRNCNKEINKCSLCQKLFINYMERIKELLIQTKVIQRYLSLPDKKRTQSEIISLVFGSYNPISKSTKDNMNLASFNEIFYSYKKGPYLIRIMLNSKTNECFYIISTITDNPKIRQIYKNLLNKIQFHPKAIFNFDRPLKLNQIFEYEIKLVTQLIKSNYNFLLNSEINDLAELIVYEITNLNPLMAFLIDDEIEEIFLDSPTAFIYIDHSKFGRCQTTVSLTPTQIESLKTRIRLESEQKLDELHPFLKTEIIAKNFHIRIAIQIYPLAFDGFSMSIRKIHKKTLTLLELLNNNTLSIYSAAYLLFSLIHGRCILVIGEPYSGKTTLINSLDLFGKKNWRKIYIEDVIESIDQSIYNIHQVRFQVNPIDIISNNFINKSFQVKECLHRTPDLIFIGELIHSKSVEAFFFLLKVGLRRSLATAHGESPELLIERFIYDDKIPSILIGNLDIIVQMNRIIHDGRTIRRVSRITEIIKKVSLNDAENSIITFNDIFLRNAKTDQLNCVFNSFQDLYKNSNIIKKINLLRGEFIDFKKFRYEMTKIQQLLDKLQKKSDENLSQIIKMFHQLWIETEINNDLEVGHQLSSSPSIIEIE